MLIGELAQCTGLTIDTVRFYEKQGLIIEGLHYERAANGYRHYKEVVVQRLLLIRFGQAAGFTLSEMSESIYAWETDSLTRDEKIMYLEQKLEDIEHKMEAMKQVRHYVISKIEAMREGREMIIDAAAVLSLNRQA